MPAAATFAAWWPGRMRKAQGEGEVTFCIPVYQGEAFVARTIESALAQSYRDIRIQISVDPGTDGSLEICERYADRPGVTVVAQKERLGWIGNCNWLLSHVETPHFCILPHDDLLDATYVERAMELLERTPDAIGVYSRILGFGDRDQIISDPDITGNAVERMLEILLTRLGALAFRAVCRVPPGGIPLLESNACNDYASDTVWFLDLARSGALLQLDQTLYYKRYHDRSEHRNWPDIDDSRAPECWLEHCVQLTAHALRAATTPAERRAILEAGAARNANFMMQGPRTHPDHPEPLSVDAFTARVDRWQGGGSS